MLVVLGRHHLGLAFYEKEKGEGKRERGIVMDEKVEQQQRVREAAPPFCIIV